MGRRPAILATLGALVGLAVLAALLSPVWRPWFAPAAQLCRVNPGDLETLRVLQEAEQQGQALSVELARLRGELGTGRAACPLPAAPQGEARAQPAALPEDRWQQRDIAMMEGCWKRETEMRTQEQGTGRVLGVRRWETCFDRNGVGRQTVEWDDGLACTGPVRARFLPDGRLGIEDTARCTTQGRALFEARYQCRRVDDGLAMCDRQVPETGARTGDIRLRR